MNKKNVLAALLSLTLCLGLLAGCGTGPSSAGSSSATAGTAEPQTRTYTPEDLEGLVSGLGDVAVLQGSEGVDLEGLVTRDDTVIQDITLEAGSLEFSTQSSVTVTWTITVDAEALAGHLGQDYDGQEGETVSIVQTTRVYVISASEAADFQTRHPEVPIYGSDNTPYDPATAQADQSQAPQPETQQPETTEADTETQNSDQGETGAGAQPSGGSSGSTGGSGSTTGSTTGSTGAGGSTTGSASETGTSGSTTQPSQPEHQHVWHDHIAQRWVENIVTVPDYETQKTPVGTNFIFSYDKFTTSDIEEAKAHAVELIYAGLPDNYRTETIYETQTVQVGSHQEDQGWYEDYVDYQYCDCGAIR